MEKYLQSAYEFYRQDVKDNYLSYEDFKKQLGAACPPCKPGSKIPFWVYLAGGAAVGYALKK
jgi:hypothetical protein